MEWFANMKVEMFKNAGGVFTPATDIEAEKLTRFKTGELYTVEVKHGRNYQFHKKVFAFMNFCFEHWQGDKEFLDEAAQFDVFRNNLTVLAGYYDAFYSISGSARIEAKSISYAKMSQDDFEMFYSSLIKAAMKHIFQGCDQSVEERLVSFF